MLPIMPLMQEIDGGSEIYTDSNTVNMSDVYVGKLVKVLDKEFLEGEKISRDEYGNLVPTCSMPLRSILFTLNENNLSRDLLYNSPEYPVLNLSDSKICLDDDKNDIVISDAYNLYKLLSYYKYNKRLNLRHIKEIRKNFFDGKYTEENSELFGIKQYGYGKWIKSATTREKQDEELPLECFRAIEQMEDGNWVNHGSLFYTKIDAFKPYKKEEGKIKKLVK